MKKNFLFTSDESSIGIDSSNSLEGSSDISSQDSSEDSSEEPSSEEQKKEVKVIVLAGQSNAVGHSYANNLSKEEYDKYNVSFDNIQINYSLSPFNSGAKKSDGFVSVKFNQGRRPNDPKIISFGPEIGIASYLSEHYPDEKFYIIKTAAGATTLHNDWYSPSSNKEIKDGNLFNYLLEFTDESMDLIKKNNENPKIISYCWMQGENDAKSYYGEYENNWTAHIKDLKEDWEKKDYIVENGLSIIDAGITNYWTNYNKINQIKEEYALKSSKNYFIDVDGSNWSSTYKDNTDYAHLDSHSMIMLGQEFGKNIDLAIKDLNNAEIVYEKPNYEANRWDGYSYSTSLNGEGSETNPYLINTTADMAFFAKDVRDGNDYANKYVKLNADLNMSHPNFTGIGDGDLVLDETTNKSKYVFKEFKGEFEGDNHNIEVRIYKSYVAGLFNASSGNIKNLSVSGTVFAINRVSGGVVGVLTGGKLENVTNKAKVSGRFYDAGKGHIGGIVGLLNNGEVYNSTNYGSIFGYVTNFADKQGVGGVIGTVEEGVIGFSNLTNNGYVYNKGFNTGGVIGLLRKGANFVTNKLYNYGEIVGKTNTGGVIGALNYSNATIDDVHNYGNVSGSNYVGGVIGSLGYDGNRNSTLSNATNSGKVSADVEVAGKDGSKNGFRCGGIAGMVFGSTLNNCINKGEVIATYLEEEQTKQVTPIDLFDADKSNKYVAFIAGYKTGQGKVIDCLNEYKNS